MIFRSQKEKPIEIRHYGMNIGLARPAGQNVVEFLVVGKKESFSQNKVSEFLSGHGAEIVSQHGYFDSSDQEFILSCIVDVSDLDCSLDELLIRLRKMKFVTKAEKSEMKGQLYSSFLFPIQVFGLHRGIVIDADSLGQMDDAMRGDEPRKISKVLFDAGRDSALRVFDELKNMELQSGKSALEAAREYLRASGWGLVSFKTEGEFAFGTVIDPPISGSKSSIAGLSYLSGFIAGILERTVGTKMHFRYANYEMDRQLMTLCLGKVELSAVVSDIPPQECVVESDSSGQNSTSVSLINDLKNLVILEKVVGAAAKGAPKVNLMNAAKLNHSEFNSLLQELTKKGLIMVQPENNVGPEIYHSTHRGEEFLDLCERMNEILFETARARMVRRETITRGYQ